MANKINILGIPGSLRKDSFNKAILYAAKELCPQAAIEIADISSFPLFNQDFETNLPEAIKAFKSKVKSADAIICATPEYNYSIPVVLKNAIDWGSRLLGQNSFDEKSVAIMSAATGMIGGARAQYNLRQNLAFLNMHPFNNPEVIVPFATEQIKDGKVVDAHTIEKIEELIEAVISWTKKLQGESDG